MKKSLSALANGMILCFSLNSCVDTKVAGTMTSSETQESSSSISTKYGVSLTDSRDGQIYKTVVIGKQTWMAQNLNYASLSGSMCYGDSTEYCSTYGRLYTWDSAKAICPMGWHLPSDSEWVSMEEFIGMDSSDAVYGGYRGSNQGTQLKADTTLWHYNTGTNSIGFSAIPGGYFNGTKFTISNNYAYFWTSTVFGDSSQAWSRALISNYPSILRTLLPESNSLSVRCIQSLM